MSHIKNSANANYDYVRLYNFLAEKDERIAAKAMVSIQKGIDLLKIQPELYVPIPERKGMRKLSIEFGESGYIVFYKYNKKTDTSIILAILHQRENYSERTVGDIIRPPLPPQKQQ